MKPLILIIRGAPGAGKSTIADALVSKGLFKAYVEADQYYIEKYGEYKWSPQEVFQAHQWCKEKVEWYMVRDYSVIVSNTFIRHQDVTPYLELADKYGYLVQEMILWETPFQNIHGVPQEVVDKKRTQLHDQFS